MSDEPKVPAPPLSIPEYIWCIHDDLYAQTTGDSIATVPRIIEHAGRRILPVFTTNEAARRFVDERPMGDSHPLHLFAKSFATVIKHASLGTRSALGVSIEPDTVIGFDLDPDGTGGRLVSIDDFVAATRRTPGR